MNQHIDIDEQLSELWLKLYHDIVSMVSRRRSIGREIKLQDCCVHSLFVDEDGILMLIDFNGTIDFVENFEDSVLYKVYDSFRSQFC